MWRNMLEEYAIRSRQYADEVATLRHHVLHASDPVSPEFLEKWSTVTKRAAACRESREEIEQYLKSLE